MYSKIFATSLVIFALFAGKTWAAEVLDDPTRPPGYRLVLPGGKQANRLTWSVSAIRIAAERRSAVINGRSVKEGDVVNGAKVVRIHPAYVQLSRAGSTWSVRLYNQIKKFNR